jgi:hypothetical protein
MDSLKFPLGLPCPSFLCPAGRPPLTVIKSLTVISGKARRHAAIFYPFGRPTPYADAGQPTCNNSPWKLKPWRRRRRGKPTLWDKKVPFEGDIGTVSKLKSRLPKVLHLGRRRTSRLWGSRSQGINILQAHTAWGIQGGRRQPQAARPAGGPPPKRL